MKDGVYEDLSFEEYLALDRLSRSSAMELLPPNTPADYWWRLRHEKEATDPMRFGSAFHWAILEPPEFGKRYTAYSKPANRQLVDEEKAAKKGVLTKLQTEDEERAAAEAGLEILPHGEDVRALELSRLFRSAPAVAKVLSRGKPEVTLLWTDRETGTKWKGRMDWGLSPTGLVLDVKSTRSLGPRHLANAITDGGYELQAQGLREGCGQHGLPWEGHILAWGRTDPKMRPAVKVEVMTGLWLRRGEILMRRASRIHAECTASGVWPGEPVTIERTPEPAWLERWTKEQQVIDESEEDFPEQ